jgi:hypothetical protein
MTTQNNLEENKRIVRAFIETAFNEHRADRAADYLTSDIKWHGGTLGTVEGRENFAGLISAIVSALPDLRNETLCPCARWSREHTRGTSSGSPRRADTFGGMRSMCTAWRTEKSRRSGLRTTCLPSSTGLARTPLPGSRSSRSGGIDVGALQAPAGRRCRRRARGGGPTPDLE